MKYRFCKWGKTQQFNKGAFLLSGFEVVCGRGGQEGGEDTAEEADQGGGRQVSCLNESLLFWFQMSAVSRISSKVHYEFTPLARPESLWSVYQYFKVWDWNFHCLLLLQSGGGRRCEGSHVELGLEESFIQSTITYLLFILHPYTMYRSKLETVPQ